MKSINLDLVEFTIKRPSKRDSSGLIKLIVDLAKFEHLKPPSKPAQRRLIHDVFVKKRLNAFLAFTRGEPVGYALYFFTYSSFLARPTMYLEDLLVLHPYRRKKIGLSLFLRCAKEAVRKKCGRMEWTVLTWNSRAINFYEKKIRARRMADWYLYRLDRERLNRLATMEQAK